MKTYLDASVIVPLLVHDQLSERAEAALRTVSHPVAVSDWTLAETASAIAKAVRTKMLLREAAQKALASMDLWVGRAAIRVEVLSADIREADLIIRRLSSSLRAPDALHVVVARRLDVTLLTFDAIMAREARALGLEVVD